MSDIRLTTPEGYFERSLEKTMASAGRIGRRRKAVVCLCLALALSAGTYFTVQSAKVARAEKEYLAWQAEMARLDIFLEVNQ